MLFLKRGKRFKDERINNSLEAVKEGLHLFQENRQLLINLAVIYVALICVSGARLFVCFSAIGIDVLLLPLDSGGR